MTAPRPRGPIEVVVAGTDEIGPRVRALASALGADGIFVDAMLDGRAWLTALARGAHVGLLDADRRDRDELLAGGLDVGAPIALLLRSPDPALEERLLGAGAAEVVVADGAPDLAAIIARAVRHALARGAPATTRPDLYRAIFDRGPDAMLIADTQGRYVDGNAAALGQLGIDLRRLRELTVFDLSRGSEEATRAAWQNFLAVGRQVGEWPLTASDGTARIFDYAAIANVTPGYHLSILRDVTERRRTESARQRLAALVESADDAIIGKDLDDTITAWNPAAERIYGCPSETAIGRSIRDFVPEDRRAEHDEIQERIARGERVRNLETVRRRPDGRLFDVSLTVSPVRNSHGRIIGASIIARDIGETVRMRARLAMADRMVSVGTLAAGVAHEINNPMAEVIANLDVARRAAGHPSPGALGELLDALHDAGDAAARVQQIVRDLRVLSRPDEEIREPIDVHRTIESSIRIAWNEIRHRAQLERSLAPVPPVQGNESRLGQVLINLLVNAAQAIPEGDAEHQRVRVATRVAHTAEGEQVVIEIGDTGTGFPPERVGRIFEPFYTTKPEGIGTGLGLYICQGIVHGMGGAITLAETSPRGSTLRVTLPAAEVHAPRAGSPPPHAVELGHRPRVMIVDDEPLVLRAMQRILSSQVDVIGVTDAREALRRIEDGERLDAVICDLMMPQMTGMDFYDHLRASAPALAPRIIFATGGTFTARARSFLEQVRNPYIEKPFTADGLLAAVRAVTG